MTTTINQSTRYVNEVEASRITGRAVQTLRNDRHKGQGIPYVRLGCSIRYRIDEIIAYMETRKVHTEPI